MSFLNQIRSQEGLPPLKLKSKDPKPRKFNPLFLTRVNDEKRGSFILTELSYQEYSKDCEEALGINFLEWLDDNKISIEKCKGGYLLQKIKSYSVMRGVMQK